MWRKDKEQIAIRKTKGGTPPGLQSNTPVKKKRKKSERERRERDGGGGRGGERERVRERMQHKYAIKLTSTK